MGGAHRQAAPTGRANESTRRRCRGLTAGCRSRARSDGCRRVNGYDGDDRGSGGNGSSCGWSDEPAEPPGGGSAASQTGALPQAAADAGSGVGVATGLTPVRGLCARGCLFRLQVSSVRCRTRCSCMRNEERPGSCHLWQVVEARGLRGCACHESGAAALALLASGEGGCPRGVTQPVGSTETQ